VSWKQQQQHLPHTLTEEATLSGYSICRKYNNNMAAQKKLFFSFGLVAI
jgi:hypothetical protein